MPTIEIDAFDSIGNKVGSRAVSAREVPMFDLRTHRVLATVLVPADAVVFYSEGGTPCWVLQESDTAGRDTPAGDGSSREDRGLVGVV